MNKTLSKTLKKAGFTLIELLVVVAIIGVLTAVLLVNLVGIRERAADTKRKSNLNQVKSSLRLYYNDNQSYPSSASCGVDKTCFVSCSGGNCTEGSEMNSGVGGTVYMKSVPEYDTYTIDASRETFTMGVELTNASDPDIAVSVSNCGVTPAEAADNTFYICTD
jgi:prepilin-type N-terminal cleavage/methylation domain-containing protein